MATAPIQERFWAKVQKTETCWLWTGGAVTNGYGAISYEGRQEGAHRVSWILHRGEIPNGLFVLHNCPGKDNPACVNPDHLWLGTHQQNVHDWMMKNYPDKLKMKDAKEAKRINLEKIEEAKMLRHVDSVNLPLKQKPSRLKAARLMKPMTQRELAAKIGTNMMSICRWEKGAYHPSPSRQKALAKALGTTVESLFGE